MEGERKGIWQSLQQRMAKAAEDAQRRTNDTVCSAAVDGTGAVLTIWRDGTFTIKRALMKESAHDRLLGIEHDADSMRRKSVTGRGAAALATGGVSLFASNNRGVVYLTVTGERTGIQTFTTRNPNGELLTSLRSLKAAGDAVMANGRDAGSKGAAQNDVADQLHRLAGLHQAGVLTSEEFTAAKARLLS